MELFDFQMRIKMNNALATVRARFFLVKHSSQLGQITETRQPKIWEIDWSYLCYQQFDNFLIMQQRMMHITGNGNECIQF